MAPYERPTEGLDPDTRWYLEIRDRLRSLNRALVVVAVLTVVALGVALWALFAEENHDRRTQAGAIRALKERVDNLEAEVERAPTRVQVSIREEQRSIDERLNALEDGTNAAIADIRQDIDELRRRIDELQQQQRRIIQQQ